MPGGPIGGYGPPAERRNDTVEPAWRKVKTSLCHPEPNGAIDALRTLNPLAPNRHVYLQRHSSCEDRRPTRDASWRSNMDNRYYRGRRKGGGHFEQFPSGTVYLVEFEGGDAIEVHEDMLEPEMA